MKSFTTLFAICGLVSTVIANPVPEVSAIEVRGGSTNIVDIWASVDARIASILDICATADVDIKADLDVRARVAAKLKADLDACAAILAEAAVTIKAAAKADVLSSNKDCDEKCIEKTTVSHTEKFCGAVDTVVKTLGEETVKVYIKPVMVSFGKFSSCLDGIVVGLGAKIGATVKAVLGLALSLNLGLDLDLDLGLGIGGIIGIGRA